MNYVLTLTDAIVGNQVSSGSTFTVTRHSTDTGTTKITATTLTSGYAVSLTGGTGIDTLLGGEGNDTITGGAGAADSLTGAGGNDTFNFDAITGTFAVASTDVITDFSFGTSSAALDIIKVDGTWSAAGVYKNSAGTTAADYTVIVLDTATYTLATAEDAAAALHTANATDYLFIWQDTLGKVHVSFDGAQTTDSAGAESASATIGLLDLVTLTGVSIATASSLIDATDFSLV